MAKFLNFFLTRKDKTFSIYWSSHRHIKGEDRENFGDALVPFLVERITNGEITWKNINARNSGKVFVVIGSVLELANKNNIVWGAGIIKSNAKINNTTVLAVRGPISYTRVIASGIKMKKIWGDPALLLPFYFAAKKQVKSFKKLVLPHYVDFDTANRVEIDGELNIIDLKTNNVEKIINEVATADFVYSSSLHGLIVAHAYGVPALWVKFTNNLEGDDIKFFDYFLSVGIRLYKPYEFNSELLTKTFDNDIIKPDIKTLNQVQMNLLKSCPFIK